MLTNQDMLVRITVGALLGASIGYERGRYGRALGLRTHVVVSLAAATFMVISSQFAFYQGYGEAGGALVQVDPSRIASCVVSAVGFLAGGAIMRAGGHVQNLTSAAGLWLVTAIGMAAGAGMFVQAVYATVLGLIVLWLVRHFEDKSEFPIRGWLLLAARERLSEVCARLERAGMIVFAVEGVAAGKVTVRFELKKSVGKGLVAIVHELEAEPGIEAVSVERST